MRRRVGLFLVVGLILPLTITADASAQGAALQLSVTSATPGQVINVSGTGFNATNANVGGVDIRLSTRDSEPLQNAAPSPQGTFGPIGVPLPASLAPGEYLVIGTQVTTRGRHTFGAPGRARLRITAAARAVPAGRSPGAAPPAVLVATILALIALAGGSALCVRRLRTLDRPLGS